MDIAGGQQPFFEFRGRELEQLFRWVKDGESASIIGVNNIGKSNLIQYLLDPRAHAHYLADGSTRYIFLRVNFHDLPDFSCRSVYSLILDQVDTADPKAGTACLAEDALAEIGRQHEVMLNAGPDELKIQRSFKLAMRICLRAPNHRLVLILDQFDRLYQKAEGQLFNNLRGLRDTYKYRVSFLVFTRDPLPDLPVDLSLQSDVEEDAWEEDEDQEALLATDSAEQAREEFYELLQPNCLYLQPYDLADAGRLLHSIAKRRRLPLQKDWIEPLHRLTGGHAGLLRMCYSHIAASPDAPTFDEAQMAQVDAVRQECHRIWASLNSDERTALAAYTRNLQGVVVDAKTRLNLKQKGMLREDDQLFSPIFALFARAQNTRLDRPISLDSGRRVVYYHGQRSQQLSRAEYLMFKLLFDHQNNVVSHEDLLHACWPNDPYDEKHSLQAITAHISRIRRKLGITDKDKLIEAKPRQGYILHNDMPSDADSR